MGRGSSVALPLFFRAQDESKMKLLGRLSLAAICLSWMLAAAGTRPLERWLRKTHTPIVSPQGAGWESAGTFNPAVVFDHGKYVMLYRAQDKQGTSRLGYAVSTDGIHFTRSPEPVLSPDREYEKGGGVEDPRLQKFLGRYYLTYTGFNGKDAQLCLATSSDLVHWERKGVILPAYRGNWNVGWTKSGAIVPEKIKGKYWMYFLGTSADGSDQTGLAWSTDLVDWTEATKTPVLGRRTGRFYSKIVEPGPPPFVTADGIVLIYNGADDKHVYRTGIAIFDNNDPSKVIFRSQEPVFEPKEEWEKRGQVPNVVFVEGLVRQGERYLLYYGAADKYVGVAEAAMAD